MLPVPAHREEGGAVHRKLRVRLNGYTNYKVSKCQALVSWGSDGKESVGGRTQQVQAAARRHGPSPKARATADSGGGASAESLLPCGTASTIHIWLVGFCEFWKIVLRPDLLRGFS